MNIFTLQPTQPLILAVDDYTDNLKVLRVILEKEGYKLTFAKNGEQALGRVQMARPDLILLDLMMPGMDGIQVCQILKDDPAFTAIPIIILTASHEVDHLVQAFEVGAADYITKPFRHAELVARVQTHLELNALRDRTLKQTQFQHIRQIITQHLLQNRPLPETLAQVAAKLQSVFHADQVIIDPGNAKTNCFRVVSSPDQAIPDLSWFYQTTTLPLEMVYWKHDQASVGALPDAYLDWLNQYQISAQVIVPIAHSPYVGAVAVHCCHTPTWTTDDFNNVSEVADYLAIALQQS